MPRRRLHGGLAVRLAGLQLDLARPLAGAPRRAAAASPPSAAATATSPTALLPEGPLRSAAPPPSSGLPELSEAADPRRDEGRARLRHRGPGRPAPRPYRRRRADGRQPPRRPRHAEAEVRGAAGDTAGLVDASGPVARANRSLRRRGAAASRRTASASSAPRSSPTPPATLLDGFRAAVGSRPLPEGLTEAEIAAHPFRRAISNPISSRTDRCSSATRPSHGASTTPTAAAITADAYLDQVAAAGYRGTELGPFGFLPTDPAALGDALAAPRPHADRRRARPHLRRPRRRAGALGDAAARRRAPRRDRRAASRHHGREQLVSARQPARARRRRLERDDRACSARRRRCSPASTASASPSTRTSAPPSSSSRRSTACSPRPTSTSASTPATTRSGTRTRSPTWRRVRDRIGYMHLKNVDPAVCARVRDGRLGLDAAFAAAPCARCPTAPSTSPPSCAGSRAEASPARWSSSRT